MKKDSYEKLGDGFINLYEQGLFIRCYEKSAMVVAEITGYRLFPNIDKKTGFVFLECGFPKDYKERIIDKDGNIIVALAFGTYEHHKSYKKRKHLLLDIANAYFWNFFSISGGYGKVKKK